MGNTLPGLIEEMLSCVSNQDEISVELKDDNIAGISLDEISDEEEEVNGDIDISLGAESSVNDMENIKSINVENAYKEEKETAIAALKVCKF